MNKSTVPAAVAGAKEEEDDDDDSTALKWRLSKLDAHLRTQMDGGVVHRLPPRPSLASRVSSPQ